MTKPLEILGRILGTNTDWDDDREVVVCYGFTPNDGVPIPPGDLQIDFIKGSFMVVDEVGNIMLEGDIVPVVSALPRNIS